MNKFDEEIAREHCPFVDGVGGNHWMQQVLAALAAARADQIKRMRAEGWRQCAQGQKTTQWCEAAEQFRRGEYICPKCGIRNDGDKSEPTF